MARTSFLPLARTMLPPVPTIVFRCCVVSRLIVPEVAVRPTLLVRSSAALIVPPLTMMPALTVFVTVEMIFKVPLPVLVSVAPPTCVSGSAMVRLEPAAMLAMVFLFSVSGRLIL